MAVDLLLFRKYIAPALGITHRFVGTEPFCSVTRKYNQDLHEWLERAPEEAPAVHVVEFPRLEINGRPVSATDVRKLLSAGDFEAMALLAPATTVALLQEKYAADDASRSAAQTVEV
jgi:[citrate (pro-3S)-lyase] ligase